MVKQVVNDDPHEIAQALRCQGFLMQAYAIGNPTTISPDSYNLNGVYKGFNLISEETSLELNEANCPDTMDYDDRYYQDESNDYDSMLQSLPGSPEHSYLLHLLKLKRQPGSESVRI